jgi:hypothetical protein
MITAIVMIAANAFRRPMSFIPTAEQFPDPLAAEKLLHE